MLSLTSYRFQRTRNVILDGPLLCNKYQNSYALQPLPRIDLQPVQRDAYKIVEARRVLGRKGKRIRSRET